MTDDFTADDIRRWIRDLLGTTAYTQKTLAASIGVSQQFVSDILKCKREPTGKVLDYFSAVRVVTYRFRKKATAETVLAALRRASDLVGAKPDAT